MKKIIMLFVVLYSFSAFAGVNEECEISTYEEIMSSKTVKVTTQALLDEGQENLEKISAISIKAQELAAEVCNRSL